MKVIYWPFNSALTLPLREPTVFVGRALWQEERVKRHEAKHIEQIARLGRWTYLLIHIWARIKTRSIWAQGHWIEDEAYAAERIP